MKCPDHPGAGVNYDHWPSFGPKTHLRYCKECSRFLGQQVLDGIRDITDESKMEWGKYRGVRMIDVPDSYLAWCVDAAMGSDAWNIALQRYIIKTGRGGLK